MLHSFLIGLSALCIAVFTPLTLLSPVEEAPEVNRLLIVEPAPAKEVTVQVGELLLPLEEYLVGVLLSEMPMSFEPEALKAQAVAARTFAGKQMEGGKHEDFDLCGQSSCCQAWTSQAALRDKLGDGWEGYWKKAEEAVEATAGEMLTYEGQLIDAVYFSCSGGMTEDAVAVWGGDVPYLQAVESPGEEDASKFASTVSVTRAAFQEKLPEADFAKGWFGDVKRTDGGGVDTMTIGGVAYKGTELRKRFGLNSTSFQVSLTKETVEFHVQGYGHRVGMSQYGANAMAKAGKDYREILAHYYKGTVLK